MPGRQPEGTSAGVRLLAHGLGRVAQPHGQEGQGPGRFFVFASVG